MEEEPMVKQSLQVVFLLVQKKKKSPVHLNNSCISEEYQWYMLNGFWKTKTNLFDQVGLSLN